MGFLTDILTAVAGPLIGGLFGQRGQREANQNNIALQRENQAWMQMMSNTAHQRETADLRAAGLNPILTATGGAGATTPTSQPARVENEWADVSNSAVAIARAIADIEAVKANTELVKKKADIIETGSKVGKDAGELYDAGKDVLGKEFDNIVDWISQKMSSSAKGLSRKTDEVKDWIEDAVKGLKDDMQKGSDTIYKNKGWKGENLEDGRPRYRPTEDGKWYDRLTKKVVPIIGFDKN